jgi:hypothetical protein
VALKRMMRHWSGALPASSPDDHRAILSASA